MIRNLNQVSFQGFGTIVPERANAARVTEKADKKTMVLHTGTADVYRAEEDVWLTPGTGMSVLSVSAEGRQFYHFLLDKAVCIRPGITFAVMAFQGESTVDFCTGAELKKTGTRENDSLRIEHQMRVEGLYTFFYQEKEQGFLFAGEAHPMIELTYVDQGSLHSVADGQDLLLKQGDIVIYGPNQWHMQYADIGVAPRFVTLSFDLSGGNLALLQNRRITAPQEVVSLLQRMLREQERMDDFSTDMIISQLNQLLMILLRQASAPRDVKLQTSNAVHSENEIIRQAQIYVATHIREKLSVPLVARQVDVSPSYLTALFHKNLQISPGEYIRRIKLQESKQMIRENNLNFTEIAAALQYSTVHHFSRQFKEKFGITPTEYAKSVR